MKHNTNIFIMISVISLGCGQYIFTSQSGQEVVEEDPFSFSEEDILTERRNRQDENEAIFFKKANLFRSKYSHILFQFF